MYIHAAARIFRQQWQRAALQKKTRSQGGAEAACSGISMAAAVLPLLPKPAAKPAAAVLPLVPKAAAATAA
jgi:hypothetical protein